MTGGVRQDAADTKSIPVNEDKNPRTAAEIRALAEEAEAEAAEAEALAAAARARSRAMQLRRQAEQAEAQSGETAQKETVQTDGAKAEEAATDSAQTEIADTREAEPDSVETEDAPDAAGTSRDTVADVEAEEPTRRRSRLRRVRRPKWSTLAACLAIIVSLAALAGSAYMIKEHRDAGRRHQRVAEFAAAARQGVVTMTSLDFHDAKQGVQRILDNATGSFKDEFLKTSDDFIKVVEQSQVVSQGTAQISGVDLDSMTKDSAVVLVAATQEVTNAAGAKQDPRNYRLIVTVARDGGQLKISKIEFVP